jgi:hypothetical protein
MDQINEIELSPTKRKIINNWRLFYELTSIAKIMNNCGDQIKPEYFNKNKVKLYTSKSVLRWPIQKMPDIGNFRVWLNYIATITKCNRNVNVKTNLGKWSTRPETVYVSNTWIHKYKQHLIIKDNIDNWNYNRLLRRKLGKLYYSHLIYKNIMESTKDYIPITIQYNMSECVVHLRSITKFEIPKTILHTTLKRTNL